MRHAFHVLFAAALTLTGACSDGTGPGGGSTLTATVNGESFRGTLSVTAVYSGNTLTFGGATTTNSTLRRIEIAVEGVTGPGTYALTSLQTGVGIYSESISTAAKSWNTSLAGGSGEVVITRLSSTVVEGTFTLVTSPVEQTGATGTKRITNGNFVMALQP